MSLNQIQDFYKKTISQTTGAGAGKIYVSAKPTPTNGYLVISPTNAALREIVRYTGTGTDSGGDYVTVANVADRGLGGTIAQVHNVGESVRINMTSLLWADLITELTNKLGTSVDFPDSDALKAYIDGISIAGGAVASTSTLGLTRMSYNSDVALGNCTITVASPAVITKSSHGLTVNDIVQFSTTGALPTGLSAGVKYYVIASGLTANDFQVSLTAGGSAVNTTVAGSGTHSVTKVTPIAVSPNDPLFSRLPSTGEKTAIAGKSGSAVGSLNKLIDEALTYSGSSTDQSQATQNTALKVGEADSTAKQNLIAQSFVAGKTPLKTITLYKKANTGTFTGDVVVTVQADVSGSPSGVALATVTILNATYNALTNDASFAVNLASNLNLDIGSTYWIVVDPSTSDNSNCINLGYQNTNVYASGALKYKNTTDGWVAITGDLYFVLTIDPSGKIPTLDSNGKIPSFYISSIFGGSGSDGALVIGSGSVNIDLGGLPIVTKNYTSISITGTGQLTFSNPHTNGTIIRIKSQGDVTLTSSTIPNIDASGMGGAGGAGSVQAVTTPNPGGQGSSGVGILDTLGNHGGNGVTGGTIITANNLYSFSEVLMSRGIITLVAGSGGGGGSGGADGNSQSISGGNGGRGGGALQINCGGALNFTSTLGVSVAGKNGSNGSNKSSSNGASGSGGGGGGSGGTCFIFYNTLISASGTINSAGGAGGIGGNATDSAGGAGGVTILGGAGGGGAGSYAGAGGNGGAQSSNSNGNAGSGGAGARAGGGGGSGAATDYNTTTTRTGGGSGAGGASENSLVVKNEYF